MDKNIIFVSKVQTDDEEAEDEYLKHRRIRTNTMLQTHTPDKHWVKVRNLNTYGDELNDKQLWWWLVFMETGGL